jgi:hypothetical protein
MAFLLLFYIIPLVGGIQINGAKVGLATIKGQHGNGEKYERHFNTVVW